MCEQKLMTLRY